MPALEVAQALSAVVSDDIDLNVQHHDRDVQDDRDSTTSEAAPGSAAPCVHSQNKFQPCAPFALLSEALMVRTNAPPRC